MSESEVYSLAEAAFILQEPVKELQRTVDRKIVRYKLVSYRGRKLRAVDYKTLVFLSWSSKHEDDFKPNLVRKLYESWIDHAVSSSVVAHDDVRVSLDKAKAQVLLRLQVMRGLEEQIEKTKSKDAVFKGTDIEVHRIASLLDGDMSTEEILEDYPSLNKEQVEFARAYAAIHPKPGRPYPKITAKSALRGADFSDLDLDD
jgi:uncharacterized protein (DUF433 family)